MPVHSNSDGRNSQELKGRTALPSNAEARSPLAGILDAPTRREFLRLAGFGFAGAALGGCQRAPEQYAIPYLTAPDEFTPGRSYEYASTCGGCSAACGLLVKNRDGRPIKLEGNPLHALSRGGLCAAGQASLLGLYDQERLQQPHEGLRPATWAAVDEAIRSQLNTVRTEKGAVRFLTGTLVSPTTRAWLHRFLATFADAKHVVHDPRSCSAILEAHARTHGVRALPHYRFEKANVIVSFDSDFLGTWISPVEFTSAYRTNRHVEGTVPRLSYHVQFEPLLSLTGTKADQRVCLAPAEMAAVMAQLAARIAGKAGTRFQEGLREELPASVTPGALDQLADELWQNRELSLVLCGSQSVELQVLANFLNHLLGNYGSTVDLAQPSYQREGNDGELENLLGELQAGKVAALFIFQSNPVHDLPSGERIAEALRRVPLVVSLASRLDETARVASFVCPDHHYLESWTDAEPVNGFVSLTQPAIAPLASTRSVLESLAAWSGTPRAAYELLRERWEKEVFPRHTQRVSFADFWDRTLHDGFALVNPRPIKVGPFNAAAVGPGPRRSRPAQGTYSLVVYSKVGMPDASHAYNAWLHELPDPISKVTWDNYACLSPATAASLKVGDGDVVRLERASGDERSGILELPAFVQPGLHDQVVGVALGYGSLLGKRFANIGPPWLQAGPTVGPDGFVGKNAAAFLNWVDGSLHFALEGVRLTKVDRHHALASTQRYEELRLPDHLALPGQELRPFIRETTLEAYRQNPAHAANVSAVEKPDEAKQDLWPADHPADGPTLGHGHRPQCLHGLFGLRHRLPGGKQHSRGRQGRGPAAARNALAAHRSLLHRA